MRHYTSWSVLRLVTATSGSNYIYADKLAIALQGFVSQTTLPDFVTFSKLQVWRSHFAPPGVTFSNNSKPENGDSSSCSTEAGGDVGGVILTYGSCTTGERQ